MERPIISGILTHRDPAATAGFDAALARCRPGWWTLWCDRDDDALAVTCGRLSRDVVFTALVGYGFAVGPALWEVTDGRVVVELVEVPRGGASRCVATWWVDTAGELLGWCGGASGNQAEVLLAASEGTLGVAAALVGYGAAPTPPPRFVGELAPVHRITELVAELSAAGWGALDSQVVAVAAELAPHVDTTAAGWAARLRARVVAICDAAVAAGVTPADVVELIDVALDADEVGALAGVAFR